MASESIAHEAEGLMDYLFMDYLFRGMTVKYSPVKSRRAREAPHGFATRPYILARLASLVLK